MTSGLPFLVKYEGNRGSNDGKTKEMSLVCFLHHPLILCITFLVFVIVRLITCVPNTTLRTSEELEIS